MSQSKRASLARVVILLVFVCMSIGGFWTITLVANDSVSSIDSPRHGTSELVEGLKDQLELIRWIGAGIVTTLAGTTAYLFRTVERQNRESKEDLKRSNSDREKLLNDVLQFTADATRVQEKLSANVHELGAILQASRGSASKDE